MDIIYDFAYSPLHVSLYVNLNLFSTGLLDSYITEGERMLSAFPRYDPFRPAFVGLWL